MSAVASFSRVLGQPIARLMCRFPLANAVRPFHVLSSSARPVVAKLYIPNLQTYRYKKKKKAQRMEYEDSDDEKKKDAEEEEEENEDEKGEVVPGTKIVSIKTTYSRVDKVLKSAYGNKLAVDAAFLSGSIRRNNEKVLKKGEEVYEGDVLDIVKGEDATNPNLFRVFRVEILDLQDHSSSVHMRVRVSRDLLIKPYDDNTTEN